MKIILDTNIYFSGYIFDKTILKLIDYVYTNCDIFCSEDCFEEIIRKLLGSKAQKLIPNYSMSRTLIFLEKIKLESKILKPKSKVTICRDQKDNIFLELVIESCSDYLITGDNDLLVLNSFHNCKILKPSQFIEELRINL